MNVVAYRLLMIDFNLIVAAALLIRFSQNVLNASLCSQPFQQQQQQQQSDHNDKIIS